jgi:hypothetical protein
MPYGDNKRLQSRSAAPILYEDVSTSEDVSKSDDVSKSKDISKNKYDSKSTYVFKGKKPISFDCTVCGKTCLKKIGLISYSRVHKTL